MTERTPRPLPPWQRTGASIAGLYLPGTDEPFYLEDDEAALSVELYPDGTGIVKVCREDGWESIFDVCHEETGP